MKERILTAILGSLLCLIANISYAASDDQMIASWVQYVSDGIEIRAVAIESCPKLTVDGKAVAMTVRTKATKQHPDTMCTARLADNAKSIRINGHVLPTPKKNPQKILIIGDTGCRVSSGHGLYQACNNSSEWPFKRLAKSAASYKPDLIIYTGDYVYREAPCPEGNSGCKGTPYGDTLATWQADWFVPAEALHQAAPMILTRGNHEVCKRAGRGWFRYLDARSYDGECKLNNSYWIADIGGRNVAVVDTANLKDKQGNPLTKRFEAELAQLATTTKKDTWIMTHRPFWGYGADDDTGDLTVQTKILQDAVRERGLPKQTSLLISAHIHLAAILGFEGGDRPPQLIIGNGGTQLVPDVEPIHEIDGKTIVTQRVINQFGYAMMDNIEANGWSITFYDQSGHKLEACHQSGKKIHCQ